MATGGVPAPSRIRSLNDLTRLIAGSEPTQESLRYLIEETVILCGEEHVEGQGDKEVEFNLVSQTCLLIRRFQDSQVEDEAVAIHFVYVVLLLTKAIVKGELDENGRCEVVAPHCVFETLPSLWDSLLTSTPTKAWKFCNEIFTRLKETWKRNPTVTEMVCVDLDGAVGNLQISRQIDVTRGSQAIVGIGTLRAHCMMKMKFFQAALGICNLLITAFPSIVSAEIFEITARALTKLKNCGTAYDVVVAALDLPLDEAMRSRLTSLKVSLESLLGYNAESSNDVQSLSGLGGKVTACEVTAEGIGDLTETITRLLKADKLEGLGNAHLEMMLSTQIFGLLSAALEQQISAAVCIKLSYAVLWLLKTLVILETGETGDCEYLALEPVMSVQQMLWRRLFTHNIDEAKRLCLELVKQLRERYEMNMPTAIMLCQEVDQCLLFLYKAGRVQKRGTFLALVQIRTIQARCMLKTEFFKSAIQKCRDVLHTFTEYDHFEAEEIWIQSLMGLHEYDNALDRIHTALELTKKEEERHKLQELAAAAAAMLKAREEETRHRLDDDWLDGTNAYTTEERNDISFSSGEVQKHRHKRPKGKEPQPEYPPSTSPPTQDTTLDGIPGSASPSPRSSLADVYADSDTATTFSDVDSVAGSDVAAIFDVTAFERHRIVSTPPETTWFDESKRHWTSSRRAVDDVDRLDLDEEDLERFGSKKPKFGPVYEEEKSVEELQHLLRNQPSRYVRCRLVVNKAHSAVCKPADNSPDIEINGRSKIGKCFKDDEVVVEVTSRRRKVNPGTGKEKRHGRIVGRLERRHFDGVAHPVLACSVDPHESQLMHPLCGTVPKLHVLNRGVIKHKEGADRNNFVEIYKVTGDRKLEPTKKLFHLDPRRRQSYMFHVVLLAWGREFHYPLGAVIKVTQGELSVSHGLKVLERSLHMHTYFSQQCIETVQKVVSSPNPDFGKGRTDFTKELTFTIDPPDSRDLDDALSLWKKDGFYEVGVHIADVSSVVEKGDSVDMNARQRGCTFYPPGGWRTYPMLPEPLSQGRCSLLPGEPRPTLSLLFRLDDKGEQHDQPQLCQAVIRSTRQLTYTQAQELMDTPGETGNDLSDLATVLRMLRKITKALRKKRLKSAIHHRGITSDPFSGNDDNASDAHALVEELMIKYNAHMAEMLCENFPSCTLLRIQDAPSPDDVRQWLSTHHPVCNLLVSLQDRDVMPGARISVTQCLTPQTLQQRKSYVLVRRDIWTRLLQAVRDKDEDTLNRILGADHLHPKQMLAFKRWTELQELACYRCSSPSAAERNNNATSNGQGHFTLGLESYCQMTSPLRRYCDLVCQRLAVSMLRGNVAPYSEQEIQEIASEMTRCKQLNNAYSNRARDLALADRLLEKPMKVIAVIEGVSEQGLDLLIPGMRSPPQSVRELPFNLLTLCNQPEVMGEGENVRCHWRRSIFHSHGNPAFPLAETHRGRPFTVHGDHLVVSVSSQNWAQLLQAAFFNKQQKKKGIKAIQERVDRMLPEADRDPPPGSRIVVSCEDGTMSGASQYCKFDRTFALGQSVQVQLGAGQDKGMLVPRVSLLWVSDNLHLCLDHVRDPVPQLVPQAIKAFRKARDVDEYVGYWIPLLEMEAATSCADSDVSVIVEDVAVTFDRPTGGSFTLPYKFCEQRGLEIGGTSAHKIDKVLSHVSRCTQFLCVRIPVPVSEPRQEGENSRSPSARAGSQDRRGSKEGDDRKFPPKATKNPSHPSCDTPGTGWVWVGHGQVVGVRRRKGNLEDRIEVTFDLNEKGAPPPLSLLATPTATGLVELLPVAETDKRAVQYLQALSSREKAANSTVDNDDGDEDEELSVESRARRDQERHEAQILARSIALRWAVPDLEPLRKDMGFKIEKDLNLPHSILPKNNDCQTKAITEALTSTFTLIQGPPGTGKTYTGLKLIYLFNEINKAMAMMGQNKKQLLFCGPSNKSVDVVARRAKRHLDKLCPRIARMYGKSVEEKDYPVPGKTWRRASGDCQSDPNILDITIHHVIRQTGKPNAEEICKYDRYFKSDDWKELPSSRLSMKLREYRALVAQATVTELKNYDVILCTCSVAGNPKLTGGTDVYQVIIDECGMCLEPHCLIPVIANHARQVVLLGDHKQLRPIVINKEAAQLGLETSLFERYHSRAKFLDTQYRMHPSICDFPSEEFYNLDLITGESRSYKTAAPLSLWPSPIYRHVLVHVDGEERVLSVSSEEGNEMSRSNEKEARKVEEICRYILNETKGQASLNVMSQYNAQRYLLREKLSIAGLWSPKVKVNTVVASQGGEWDYVVFTTVRSLPEAQIEETPTRGWSQRHLGFITDQNQINVALTRARKGLIIVGNTHLLKKDPVWNRLYTHYQQRGCVVDGSTFPPRRSMRPLP